MMRLSSFALLACLAAPSFTLRAAPEANTSPASDLTRTATKKPDPAATPPKPASGAKDSAEKTPVGKKLEIARKLRKVNRFPEAFAKVEEARALAQGPAELLEVDFAHAQLYFSQAQAIVQKRLDGGDPAQIMAGGIEIFKRISEEHRDTTEGAGSAYLLGSSYFVLDDLANAMAAYNRSYSEFPKSHLRSKSLLRIGVCQAGLGQATEAAQTYRRLRTEFPDRTAELKKVNKYLVQLGMVGRQAPKITAEEWVHGLIGQEDIQTFRESVVVVVFFATWCSHCSHNMPRLQGMIDEWQNEGVVFLGVANPNDPMNTEPVDAYIEKKGLRFDDVGLDHDYSSWRGYRVSGLPATAVIDRTGIVRWRGNLSFLPESLLSLLLRE